MKLIDIAQNVIKKNLNMGKVSKKGKSSHIEQVQYDDQNYTLTIKFSNGSVYQYSGIPGWIASGLQTAESMGSYLAEYIKGKFPYKRVG
jgi:sulfite reductase beta subunit-like hemoprotein